MSNITSSPPNELQQIIEAAEIELRNTGHTPFTPNAFQRLKEKISEYAVQLITESVKVARRRESETVSSHNVEHASQYLVSSTSRKVFRHVGTIGGILLGIAGSNVLTMMTTAVLTVNGVIVTVVLTLVGGILIAAQIAKE